MRIARMTLILSIPLLVAINTAWSISVVFVDGLVLPGTTKALKGTSSALKDNLARYRKNQSSVAFLIANQSDFNSAWGCTGSVTGTTSAGDYTITLKDMIEVYNPQSNIKEITVIEDDHTPPYTEHLTAAYRIISGSPLANKLPADEVNQFYKFLSRKYQTKQLQQEMASASSYNQLIQIIAERVGLDITPEKAVELLINNSFTERKKNILAELLFQQNKSSAGGPDEGGEAAANFYDQLNKLNLPRELHEPLLETIDRYERSKQSPHEGPSLEAYLKFALALPWKDSFSEEQELFDLEAVATALDNYQYGMEQIKDTVLTHLALRMVSNGNNPLVLCLVGAPGTGKTSISQNIAKALNKKLYTISLGGVHAQSDICGTSRTYINAAEGKILRGLKTTKSASCVILLDEIDKMGLANEWHGSPADALLPALDPEQNKAFHDDYLALPFNISKVIFIATANKEANIPQALRDRMMVIQVPSYTREEKIAIAKEKVIPKLLSRTALMSSKPVFSDEVIGTIIDNYTFEDGLRGLQAQLNLLIGKFARAYLRGETITFTVDNISEYLGTAHNSLAAFKRRAKAIEPYLEKATRKKLFDAIELFDAARERTQEYDHLRTYISTFLDMPWKPAKDATDYNLKAVSKKLDQTHYGAHEVKDQILDYLAMAERTGNALSTTLCLVGAPGVGKTSIAESIAHATNRPFARLSMGGIQSSVDIRGLGGEYRGGHIGAIAKALSEAGALDAVIVVDEIDKIQHPSIAGALLDMLDPNQNKTFIDDYLGVPIDLSKVLFIATANDVGDLIKISYPLFDRMTLVEMPSYTEQQKVEIAENYVLPQLLKVNNLKRLPFLTDDLLRSIINDYTFEGGVRQLTKRLKTIIARYLRSKAMDEEFTLTKDTLPSIFGAPSGLTRDIPTEDQIGVVNGLFVIPSRGTGGILVIQVNIRPGTGVIHTTGMIERSMEESIKAASSYVKTHCQELFGRYAPHLNAITPKDFERIDIHIHATRGVQKDGNSAGLAFCTALISALSQRPFDHTCAMTGEIDINGNALAIGGVAEKLEGARKAGIKHVFVPEENRADVETMKEKPAGVKITFVRHINEILPHVLQAPRTLLRSADLFAVKNSCP